MKTQMTPAALGALRAGDIENFISAATPGGIEAQEKRGQIEQSFLETLPIKGTAECRPVWEKLGFEFGSAADDIFVNVKFPKGWRKKVTDHDMWSKLVDDKGRERAGIFYKAAFYDRSAHISLSPRFSYSTEPLEGWNAKTKSGKYVGVVTDCGEIVFQTEPTTPEPKYSEAEHPAWMAWQATKDQKSNEAKEWLTQKYPNWQDVSAYWA